MHVYISEKYYVYILYVFIYNIFSKYGVYLYTHIMYTKTCDINRLTAQLPKTISSCKL